MKKSGKLKNQKTHTHTNENRLHDNDNRDTKSEFFVNNKKT